MMVVVMVTGDAAHRQRHRWHWQHFFFIKKTLANNNLNKPNQKYMFYVYKE